MTWYRKYLSAYNSSPDDVPSEIIDTIGKQLRALQSNLPLVTVSVIAYNEEKHLLACLWSLSDMKCKYPIEIIGVNNNSKDRTEEIFKRIGIPYFNEKKQGPGHARQKGLNEAQGKFHICIDADSLYPKEYVETHVKALQKKGVICSFSLWSFINDTNRPQPGRWLYEFLRDIYLNIQYIQRPELCVRGMAFSFHTKLGQDIGFRTDIIRGEDGSLALALKKYGKIAFIHSPKARVVTGYGTISTNGSLFDNFKIRIIKAIKNLPGIFIRKAYYKDEKSNMIDN